MTVSQGQSVKGPLSVIVPLHSSSFHLLLSLSLSTSLLVLHLKPCSGNQHFLLLRHPLRTLWIQMVLFCIYSFLSPTLKAPLIRRIEKGDLMRSAPHNFLRGRAVLNLNQTLSAEYSKNPSWNYLEIAWRFIHIKKCERVGKKSRQRQKPLQRHRPASSHLIQV